MALMGGTCSPSAGTAETAADTAIRVTATKQYTGSRQGFVISWQHNRFYDVQQNQDHQGASELLCLAVMLLHGTASADSACRHSRNSCMQYGG
jgi:hypothetical protein